MRTFEIILGFAFFLLLLSCKSSDAEFKLSGEAPIIKDGTTLYMKDASDGSVLDSSMAMSGKFVFETKLPYEPIRVVIYDKIYSQYKILWLDKAEMTLSAANGNLQSSDVKGSKAEVLINELDKKVAGLAYHDQVEITKTFIKKQRNNSLSAFLLSDNALNFGKEETTKLFEKLSGEIKATVYGQKVKNFLKYNQDMEVGNMYVDFDMRDTSGATFSISKLTGKITYLDFWASWCVPCRRENPFLVKVYEDYKDKGFEIIGISIDVSSKAWKKAIENDKLPWTQLSDLKGSESKAALIYGVGSIPDNFLIDENGKIIAREISANQLRKLLEERL